MNWEVFKAIDSQLEDFDVIGVIHVAPINDLCEHDTITYDCLCNPVLTVDVVLKYAFVRHNSFDGREYKEKGNQKFGKEE